MDQSKKLNVNIINQIRTKAGDIYLKKSQPASRPNRRMIALSEAKTIGVYYNLESEDDYKLICDWQKIFQEKQIQVKALGFFNGNVKPIYAIEKLSLDFYFTKDLNWFGKPTSNYVRDFINFDFDIFIDFSLKDSFQNLYVSQMSKAKFKVGRDETGHAKIYDFMLKIDAGTSVSEYSNFILHYLQMFNNQL